MAACSRIVNYWLLASRQLQVNHSSFKPGESLQNLAVVTDWSDAEVRGLCDAVGEQQLGQALVHGVPCTLELLMAKNT